MIYRKRFQAGFSLIELAVVLVIIGLILGGVLKGRDLIDSARLNSIQVQANELRTATRTFYKKWAAWPGDISASDATRIATGLSGLADGTAGLGDGTVNGNRISAGTATEATWFWQHLRAAGFFAGVPAVANGTLGATQAVVSRMGGVWTFNWAAGTMLRSSNATLGVPEEDHWFLLGNDAGGSNNVNPVVTPSQLRSIDLKSDDGMPNTGNIVGGNNSANTCRSGSADTSAYATGTAISCVAWFRL